MKLTICLLRLVGWRSPPAVATCGHNLTSNTPAPMTGPVASAVMIWNTLMALGRGRAATATTLRLVIVYRRWLPRGARPAWDHGGSTLITWR